MSIGNRLSSAFDRIAAATSVRRVRKEDAAREQRLAGTIPEVKDRMVAFTAEVEAIARRLEADL